MFPEGFIQRVEGQKYIDAKALLKALEEPSPVSIRINPAKWNKVPLNAEPVSWSKNGYYLGERPSFTLDPLFHSGCYYPQEASGMFLEQVIRQTAETVENIRVLDLCGAPGGKSTHLSDMIGPDNLLVANEVIRTRAVILAETVTKWGTGNVLVTRNDPVLFGKLPGFFDIILVDAPCSGEGMFRSNIAVNEWSAENISHCSERQKRIIMDIWPALKENGILIYSTCTFNPGENEENIKWLTEKQEAKCIQMDVSGFKEITEIDFNGIYGYGFYPDKVRGEGFFISVVRKKGKQEKNTVRISRKSQSIPDKNDMGVARDLTHFPKERLLKWGDELFAVPCMMDDYLQLFASLTIVKPGTKLFTVKRTNYLPSHEMVLTNHLKKDSFPRKDIGFMDALAFLSRDSFTLHDIPRGWNIVSYKGVNLGFVNNIGTRVNNYFPVEWRIRMNRKVSDIKNIIKWEADDGNIT